MHSEIRKRQQDTADLSTRLTYLLIGGGIGAVLALLFAPKSGHELRGDIADVTRKGIDRSREAATQIGSKAGEYYSVAADRAGDIADAARDVAARKSTTISAAIQAGKQAYSEEKRKTELSGMTEAGPTYYELDKKS